MAIIGWTSVSTAKSNPSPGLLVVRSLREQPQTAADILRTFALMFDRLPAGWQPRAEDLVLRGLSALGEHVPTHELNEALAALVRELDAAGRGKTAARVRAAQEALAASVGKLGSRATRVSGNG